MTDHQLYWLTAVLFAGWLYSRFTSGRDYYVVIRRHYLRRGYTPFLSTPVDYYVEVFDDLVAAQAYVNIHETDYLGVLETLDRPMEILITVMTYTGRRGVKDDVMRTLANPKKAPGVTDRVLYQTSRREIERRRKHWSLQRSDAPECVGPPPSGF